MRKPLNKLLAATCGIILLMSMAFTQSSGPKPENALFEEAVRIIKKYETLHKPRHWPLVGYGHKVLPGEKFSRGRALTEAEADKILRKDLLKNCAVFREFGKDSLILGVLAYNIGSGAVKRSSIVKMLKQGNRKFEDIYISHCRYRGKVHKQIQQRRKEEFASLYVAEEEAARDEPSQAPWAQLPLPPVHDPLNIINR